MDRWYSACAGNSWAVRLKPCGHARARLVDPTGKPLAEYRDPYLISMIVTPGQDGLGKDATDQDRLSADGDYLSRIDPVHYHDLVSDTQGRITFEALIPDATYRINDTTTEDQTDGRETRKVFVAVASETLDLGDIVVEKPEVQ
jgi:hypothetical protein